MNSQETIDLKMVSKEESEPRLLIIRGLAIVLVIWVAAQLYVISATGGDQSDRSLSSILNEKSMKAKELQDRLNVLVALGFSKIWEDIIISLAVDIIILIHFPHPFKCIGNWGNNMPALTSF